MIKKDISLLVMENDTVVRKPLAEINFDTLDYTINAETYDQYWNENKEKIWASFEPEELIKKYLQSTKKIYTLFKPLFSVDTTFSLNDKIRSVGITFAGWEAYNKLRSGHQDVSYSVSLYHKCKKGEIFQRIAYRSLDKIGDDSIHEFGHAMDHLLNPVNLDRRTLIMKEVMAIFVEEKLGIDACYAKPPHRTAKDILWCLAHTRFSFLNFAEQWNFLNGILDHEDISRAIADCFPQQSPLIKIIDTISFAIKSYRKK